MAHREHVAAVDHRTAGDVADFRKGVGPAGPRQAGGPKLVAVRRPQRHQFARREAADHGVAGHSRTGGRQDPGWFGQALVGPVLLAVGGEIGQQFVVDVDHHHPAVGHGGRRMHRRVGARAPADGARSRIDLQHLTEAARHVDLAVRERQAAAEAFAVALGLGHDVDAPDLRSGPGVVSRHFGLAVHHIDPALGQDRRRRHMLLPA